MKLNEIDLKYESPKKVRRILRNNVKGKQPPQLPLNQAVLLNRVYQEAIREEKEQMLKSLDNRTILDAEDFILKSVQSKTGLSLVYGYEIRLAGIAERVDEHQAKQAQRILGIDIYSRMPEIYGEFIQRNVALIRASARVNRDFVKELIRQATLKGARNEEIKKILLKNFRLTESRARLIARDQILKLNSNITEYRYTKLGIERYEWSTSRDEKVREYHKKLEGKVFQFGKPPIVDKKGRRLPPGQDYQCRCTAIPRI